MSRLEKKEFLYLYNAFTLELKCLLSLSAECLTNHEKLSKILLDLNKGGHGGAYNSFFMINFVFNLS